MLEWLTALGVLVAALASVTAVALSWSARRREKLREAPFGVLSAARKGGERIHLVIENPSRVDLFLDEIRILRPRGMAIGHPMEKPHARSFPFGSLVLASSSANFTFSASLPNRRCCRSSITISLHMRERSRASRRSKIKLKTRLPDPNIQ
jgi:hypothetical protein